jgi:hypothetical protein
MTLDFFDTAYRLSLWRGLPVTTVTVPVSRLRDALPDFELRSFGEEPNNNPRMRCIIRMPTIDDPHERPVAVVSDQYDLLQYRVMATWLQSNLSEAGLKNTEAKISITEYGERIRITVPLVGKQIDLATDPIDPDHYQPELEVINSVDRSSAFTFMLRWRRLICLNGMFTVEEDRMRSIHRVDLSRTQVVRDFMADRLIKTPDVVSELRQWKEEAVSKDAVQKWTEDWLREKGGWTVENCARLWAILESGYDGAVEKPRERFEKNLLSAYRVGQHRQVPGVPFPIKTAYDLAQLLTWITSNQRSLEFQTEGTEAVPHLVRAFLSSDSKRPPAKAS